MQNNEQGGKPKWTLRRIFGKNRLILLISLIFAIILWGYVLADTNPERIKTVSDVGMRFEGEDALLDRRLVVRGDKSTILQNVKVNIKTHITTYADVVASDVQAVVNLSNVGSAGIHRLPVNATTRIGSVDSVSPDYIEVEIDDLASKKVPVELQLSGELPDGYYMGSPELGTSVIEIQGAKRDVDRVRKAVCEISLTGLEKSVNEAVSVVLEDSESVALNASLFVSLVPSVNVKIEILPTKTVPIDVSGAILGTERLPANYELVDISANPESMLIAADQSVLDTVDKLEIESASVAGATESIYSKVNIKIPDGVHLIGANQVELFIDINEKQASKRFDDIPIEVDGLSRSLEANLSADTIGLNISGGISAIDPLTRKSIKLSVDLTSLKEGIHNVEIAVTLPEKATGVAVVLDNPNVIVTITKK